jgi:hypothetical protein
MNDNIYASVIDTIYLTPYQEAICTDTTPVLLCRADRQLGTTTGFANLCKQYTDKEDLIVLFCGSRHYNEYHKIIYPNKYTEESSPKNIIHRETTRYVDTQGILDSISGCKFKHCVLVMDDVLLSEGFICFVMALRVMCDDLQVRVKEINGLDVRYKDWYKEDGSYVDNYAGLDFKMLSGRLLAFNLK